MIFKKLLATAGIAALLAVPSAALAQSSTEGYGGNGNVVAGIEQSGGGGGGDSDAPQQVAATPSSSTGSGSDEGSLPFTGADLGVLAVAGSMLLALGFGLRRLTHHPSQA